MKPLDASLAPQEKGRLPTEAELGQLPWRLEAAAISSQSRLAGLLIWLTAQRIETVITARKEDFEAATSQRNATPSTTAGTSSGR